MKERGARLGDNRTRDKMLGMECGERERERLEDMRVCTYCKSLASTLVRILTIGIELLHRAHETGYEIGDVAVRARVGAEKRQADEALAPEYGLI